MGHRLCVAVWYPERGKGGADRSTETAIAKLRPRDSFFASRLIAGAVSEGYGIGPLVSPRNRYSNQSIDLSIR